MPNKRADGLVMARFWVPEDLWKNADAVIKASGSDRSKELIAYLRWRTGEPDAQLPTPAERAGGGE